MPAVVLTPDSGYLDQPGLQGTELAHTVLPDAQVVINYSFPLTTEDYVHRIGRTGRAGKTGEQRDCLSARAGIGASVHCSVGKMKAFSLQRWGYLYPYLCVQRRAVCICVSQIVIPLRSHVTY